MSLTSHGSGNPLDQHNLDPLAHSGIFATKAGTAPDLAAPQLIIPPGSVIAASALATWYVPNAATYLRFHNPFRQTFRWINIYIGAISGNMQVGVSAISRTGTTVNSTKVMDSTVIAMSSLTANANARIDCGATILAPGDYAMFLWCDNTTASFMHSLATGLTASRMLFSQTVSGGITSSVLTLSQTTRWVSGMTLETDS